MTRRVKTQGEGLGRRGRLLLLLLLCALMVVAPGGGAEAMESGGPRVPRLTPCEYTLVNAGWFLPEVITWMVCG